MKNSFYGDCNSIITNSEGTYAYVGSDVGLAIISLPDLEITY